MIVAVLGGGQLARMLALAAAPLGLRVRALDPSPEAPVTAAGDLVLGAYDDVAALDALAEGADVVTYEFENVPAASAERLARGAPVLPPPLALAVTQERLVEKELLARLGVPTPRYAAVDGPDGLAAALDVVGLPAVLKTRRSGYDGKGQLVLRDRAAAAGAWEALGGVPLIAEELVAFARELSLVAVRSADGATACYPLVENVHVDGILRSTRAPAAGSDALQAEAERHAQAILAELRYVGVLAIEWFERDGALLANELAPRVHNSGHWTIEGAETSQFSNHLRAIVGLPLGSTAPRGPSEMRNLIGELPAAAAVLGVPGASLHVYGKAPRPGRKLGHVTIVAPDDVVLDERLALLDARLASPSHGR